MTNDFKDRKVTQNILYLMAPFKAGREHMYRTAGIPFLYY